MPPLQLCLGTRRKPFVMSEPSLGEVVDGGPVERQQLQFGVGVTCGKRYSDAVERRRACGQEQPHLGVLVEERVRTRTSGLDAADRPRDGRALIGRHLVPAVEQHHHPTVREAATDPVVERRGDTVERGSRDSPEVSGAARPSVRQPWHVLPQLVKQRAARRVECIRQVGQPDENRQHNSLETHSPVVNGTERLICQLPVVPAQQPAFASARIPDDDATVQGIGERPIPDPSAGPDPIRRPVRGVAGLPCLAGFLLCQIGRAAFGHPHVLPQANEPTRPQATREIARQTIDGDDRLLEIPQDAEGQRRADLAERTRRCGHGAVMIPASSSTTCTRFPYYASSSILIV